MPTSGFNGFQQETEGWKRETVSTKDSLRQDIPARKSQCRCLRRPISKLAFLNHIFVLICCCVCQLFERKCELRVVRSNSNQNPFQKSNRIAWKTKIFNQNIYVSFSFYLATQLSGRNVYAVVVFVFFLCWYIDRIWWGRILLKTNQL